MPEPDDSIVGAVAGLAEAFDRGRAPKATIDEVTALLTAQAARLSDAMTTPHESLLVGLAHQRQLYAGLKMAMRIIGARLEWREDEMRGRPGLRLRPAAPLSEEGHPAEHTCGSAGRKCYCECDGCKVN